MKHVLPVRQSLLSKSSTGLMCALFMFTLERFIRTWAITAGNWNVEQPKINTQLCPMMDSLTLTHPDSIKLCRTAKDFLNPF